MTPSMKDLALFVKLFYKNKDSEPVALQKLPTLRGMKNDVGLIIIEGVEVLKCF